jgi:hypothetical protein
VGSMGLRVLATHEKYAHVQWVASELGIFVSFAIIEFITKVIQIAYALICKKLFLNNRCTYSAKR